jgi:hypothetical protein
MLKEFSRLIRSGGTSMLSIPKFGRRDAPGIARDCLPAFSPSYEAQAL